MLIVMDSATMNAEDRKACDEYDLVEAELKSFTCSAVWAKVMLCLLKGEMTADDLEKEMGLRDSTILHSVEGMVNSCLTLKATSIYYLTCMGRIQALVLDDLMGTIIELDGRRDSLRTHGISGIPPDLFMKIGMLAQSKILEAHLADPSKVLENLLAELKRPKAIYRTISYS